MENGKCQERNCEGKFGVVAVARVETVASVDFG